jgi:hypothetical protein
MELMFAGVAKFVDSHYAKLVDGCILATLLSLWSHETFGKGHQVLTLGLMIGFSSTAIVAYFVRLFSTPGDQNQALAKSSHSVGTQGELTSTTNELADLLEFSLKGEEAGTVFANTGTGTRYSVFHAPKTYSIYATFVDSLIENREDVYVRRLTEIINTLSANPHGIEYEFYFNPDSGLRITKVSSKERRVSLEEVVEETESLVGRVN